MNLARALRRRPAALYVVAVILGSPFGYAALGHVQAARPMRHAARPAVAPRAVDETPALRGPDKSGAALAARNMFCATCEPPSGGEPPDDRPPRAPLPLELLATNVASRDDRSFATVRHRDHRRVGAYRTGDVIPDGGTLRAVRGRYIVIRREGSDDDERLELAATTVSPAPTAAPPEPAPADGIAAVGTDHYQVDRDVIDAALANPMSIGARVRLGPSGVRLFGVRGTSPLASLGLRNGDTITAANGMSLSDADALLEVYGRLRTATQVELTIERGGAQQTLRYDIQ